MRLRDALRLPVTHIHLVWGYVAITDIAAAVLARQSCGIRATIDHAPQRDLLPLPTPLLTRRHLTAYPSDGAAWRCKREMPHNAS